MTSTPVRTANMVVGDVFEYWTAAGDMHYLVVQDVATPNAGRGGVGSGPDLVDTALATEVLALIRTRPALHDQRLWTHEDRFSVIDVLAEQGVSELELPDVVSERVALLDRCGTTGCIAGWAVLLADPNVVITASGGLGLYESRIGPRAANLLGLDVDNANALFDADNTVGDLHRILHLITRGAIELPAEYADHDSSFEPSPDPDDDNDEDER